MKKRIFLIAICILLAASFVGAACAEAAEDTAPTSGTCGENLTWELVDGTLTISGTGEMKNYTSSSPVPWADNKDTIQTVIVNSGVTTIGSFAFSGCGNLTSISLPNGLMSIGERAMFNCIALVSIDIPDTVTSIGNCAFYCASRLARVHLPSGISSIPNFCFSGCALTEISIPEGVTRICDCAFQSNSSLQSVYMPSTIDTIEDMAFEDCSSLTDVYYNSTKADWQAINIGVNNSELRKAVWHCTDGDAQDMYPTSGSCGENLTWELVDGTLTISGTGEMENYSYYSSVPWADKKDTIQTVIVNSGVTTIGSYAFYALNNLTSISLPNGLMSIGELAMCHCDALVSIDIPDTVTSIGAGAFNSASRLASVQLPSGISSIPIYCFYNCALTEISIPEGVTKICVYAFQFNSNLQSVYMPSTIDTIEDMAFEYCSSLTDVYYNSTKADWQAIDIGVNNSKLRKAVWHCTDGDSGTCGENLTWELVDGTLTISGTGEMENYSYFSSAPWADEKDTIQTVIVNSGVTTIGSYAFYALNNLTSISLPNGLMSIGASAMYDCDALVSIDIPNTVISIESKAFSNCDNLENITLSASLTTIGEKAFYYSESLSSIIIPDSVTSIGDSAFEGDNRLASVHLPSGISSIPSYCFYRCALTEISIPEGVTKICVYAFHVNSSLQSVCLPSTIETIEERAFNNCSSLTDVYYNSTQAEGQAIVIDAYNSELRKAVWHCTDGDAQDMCPTSGSCGENLTWELVEGTLTISGTGEMENYTSSSLVPWADKKDTIQTVIVNSGVTTIGSYAFSGCGNLTSISLPNGLMSIGERAMVNCIALLSIDIPDTVTSIGIYAFYSARRLASVQLPSGISSIPSYCFYRCALTEISIPEGVTRICDCAFQSNSSLQSVYMPSTIDTIEDMAFEYCRSLTDVYYNSTQAEGQAIDIGANNSELRKAVWHCTDGDSQGMGPSSGTCGDNLTWELVDGTLTISGTGEMENYTSSSLVPWVYKKNSIHTVIVNSGVTTIGSYAFSGCGILTSISLPNGLMSIGESAMNNCKALVSIEIPNTVTSIESYAFSYCNNLENITLSASLTSIGAKAFYCSYSLSSIIIPDSVTSIGDSAFEGDNRLASVHLPSGISSIPSDCFYNCALTEISIPEGVTIIREYAFGYNSSLQSVCLPSTIETIENRAFSYCSSLTDVYYNSTQEEGQAIVIGGYNSELRKAVWHCTDGDSQGMGPSSGTCGENLTWEVVDDTLIISGTGAMNDYYLEFKYWPWEGKCTQIKSLVVNSGVTTIGHYAFYGLNNLTSVSLPDGLTSIGPGAYAFCEALTEITIPESVTKIGPEAFANNCSLQSISLPTTIKQISPDTFYDCKNLSDVFYAGTQAEAEEMEISMGNAEFVAATWHCSDGVLQGIGETSGTCGENLTWDLTDGTLTISGTGPMDDFSMYTTPWVMRDNIIRTVVIEEGVTSIGSYAFYACHELTSIVMPDSVTSIGSQAFAFDRKLSSVQLSSGLVSIPDWCFAQSALTEITIPEGIVSIDRYAFWQNSNLQCVSLPSTIETIVSYAFIECDNLTDVYYPGTQEDTEAITIGEGNDTLSAATWHYSYVPEKPLTVLELPASLTVISQEAFANVAAGKIVIPATVTTIEARAFADSAQLKVLYFEGSPETIADDILSGCRSVTISVAEGSTAEAWATENGYTVEYHG